MSRKEILLVAVVAALAGLYVYYFTDWFRPRFIRIEHTVRSLRDAWDGGRRVAPASHRSSDVTFALHKNYRLTSVEVVPLAEFSTNKYAHPLWHLVAEKGSKPVNGFVYGMPIAGMTSSVAGIDADLLQPGVEYRLLVRAGSLTGTNDFTIPGSSTARR